VGGGLLDLIPAHRGHFAYTSGDHGDLWLDLDALFAHPRRLRPYVTAVADLLPQCDVVCGPLTGGAYLAQSVADTLDTDFAWTEGRTLTGDVTDRRVAIVDDAINAGSAVGSTAASLQRLGARPVALGALLVLGDSASGSAASLGVGLESVERAGNSLWSPDSCPACAAGVPLTS